DDAARIFLLPAQRRVPKVAALELPQTASAGESSARLKARTEDSLSSLPRVRPRASGSRRGTAPGRGRTPHNSMPGWRAPDHVAHPRARPEPIDRTSLLERGWNTTSL